MAIVIRGELVSLTFLTLFLMPALYLRFGGSTVQRPEIPREPAMGRELRVGMVRTQE
jgi:hypothetical protein